MIPQNGDFCAGKFLFQLIDQFPVLFDDWCFGFKNEQVGMIISEEF